MGNSIDINQLADAIEHELEMYSEELQENLDYAADMVSKQLVNDIREDSPKDQGYYEKSWTRSKRTHYFVVYNKKYGWLTHLLEFGFQLRNGKRKSGKPHIYKNAERASINFEDMTVKIISEGVRFK